MSIQSPPIAENRSSQTGTRLARPSFGRLHNSGTLPTPPHLPHDHHPSSSSLSTTIDAHLSSVLTALSSLLSKCQFVTVYGTLVTIWTTAPSQRPPVQLAAVCLILATLTIAARCYASPPGGTLGTNHDNSNNSSIVLGATGVTETETASHRHNRPVQSDTSILITNSKESWHPSDKLTAVRKKRSIRTDSAGGKSATGTASDRSSDSAKNSSGSAVRGGSGGFSDRRTNSTTLLEGHQNDGSFDRDVNNDRRRGATSEGTARPMPPVHDHGNASSPVTGVAGDLGVLVLVLSAIVVLTVVALGLVTCVLSHHYRPSGGERGAAADGGTAADQYDAARPPTTAPMLSVVSAGAAAGVGGMDRLRGGRAARELAAARDRQVRLHAVHKDLAINLPPSIAMPDGEEHPFTTHSSRLHLRDPDQESEIHQKCIRPPPNRTVLESESPPPYRPGSATGLLGSCASSFGTNTSNFNITSSSSSSNSSTSSSSSSSNNSHNNSTMGGASDWATGVVRCHSMSYSSSTSSANSSMSSSTSMCMGGAGAGGGAGGAGGGQKTDFLQRTVKKFTGGGHGGGSKKGAAAAVTNAPPPPAVVVPVAAPEGGRTRRPPDYSSTSSTQSKAV